MGVRSVLKEKTHKRKTNTNPPFSTHIVIVLFSKFEQLESYKAKSNELSKRRQPTTTTHSINNCQQQLTGDLITLYSVLYSFLEETKNKCYYLVVVVSRQVVVLVTMTTTKSHILLQHSVCFISALLF